MRRLLATVVAALVALPCSAADFHNHASPSGDNTSSQFDRVQVFLNGKPDPKLNFTRAANPDAFGSGVVKFERTLPLELSGDTHVIVAAIGENSGLGHVMGPEHEHDQPTAVTNPIYVDVDGGGFKPNKDTLGAPLPVKAPGSK